MKKLIKQFLNVKNVKVLGAKFEASNNSIVFKLQPTKGQQCLCPICGKKSEFYDKGRGLRRWRSLDFGTLTAFVESESPRIKCRNQRRKNLNKSEVAAVQKKAKKKTARYSR